VTFAGHLWYRPCQAKDFAITRCCYSFKNNGGLITPSYGTVSTVMLAERYIRASGSLLRVQTNVMQDIGSQDVFSLGNHIAYTTVGIDNHHFSMIRLVVEAFFDLRQHHRVNLHNIKLHGSSIRHKNNKATLFMGQ